MKTNDIIYVTTAPSAPPPDDRSSSTAITVKPSEDEVIEMPKRDEEKKTVQPYRFNSR